MSKVLFSENDIVKLQNNPNVINVSSKSITYSDEFKRLFIEEYLKGKLPRDIFMENGFDVNVLGVKRIEQAAYRWNAAYKKDGIIGLSDNRKHSSGRPLQRELSKDELIKKQEAKIALLEAQVELLKKLDAKERGLINRNQSLNKSYIFELIHNTVRKYNFNNVVKYLCDLMGVSRSGYYNFLNKEDIRLQREQNDIIDKNIILKAFNRRGYKKGKRSIKMILESEFNIIFSLKKISRLMNKFDIVCPHRKANPYKRIAKATKEHRTVPNLLNREFKQNIPGKVLLTDITYLPYNNSKDMAYLSTILDASTNEILAYKISESISLDIALDTIENLTKTNRIKLHKDAFIHSDQGFHYTSPVFQALIKSKKLGQSMSRRGNCWDNAPQESFFGHLKDSVKTKYITTFQELQKQISKYITYHNNYRYQWGLKKMTPVQYRNHLLAS